jgi:hypothetical protein
MIFVSLRESIGLTGLSTLRVALLFAGFARYEDAPDAAGVAVELRSHPVG